MFFPDRKKNAGAAILEHWESTKGKKEIDEKPNFKEAGLSKMADGGEVDGEHDGPFHAISSDMIDAFHNKDPKALHESMKAYLEQHELRSNQDPKDEGSEDKEND